MEEGRRKRPAAIPLMVGDDRGGQIVTVPPTTHRRPEEAANAIALPTDTRRRLRLNDLLSWVVPTEANRFPWPVPDVQPRLGSGAFGLLSPGLFGAIRDGFAATALRRRTVIVDRAD